MIAVVPLSPLLEQLEICYRSVHAVRDTLDMLIIPQNPKFIYNKFIRISFVKSVAKIVHAHKGNAGGLQENKRRINMKRMFGFLIGVFAGAMIGSTIALLLAPESGEELRAQIRVRGQNFSNDIRHAADERKIELRQKLDELRAPRDYTIPTDPTAL